jgi:hypothetical protein
MEGLRQCQRSAFHSRIIFSLNSKGGSGNTAAMVALADFLIHNLGLNPKLVDCDLV